DAADLILTKPGGLSTTEAAVKGLPMLFINAVPGCETRNYEFFLKGGGADMRGTVTELCDAVCDCLEDSERLSRMSETLKSDFPACAVEAIRNYVLKDVDCVYGKL